MSENEEITPPDDNQRLRRRRIALVALAIVFAGAGIAYGGWWAAVGRYTEATDDAYVAGNQVPVMAEAGGTVVAVLADETHHVRQGQVLVRLDDADARVALRQAEANLASTVRHVVELYATAKQLKAGLAARKTMLAQARSDYARHRRLQRRGYYPKSELEHDATLVQVDLRKLAQARHGLAAARAQTANTDVHDHPAVKLAAAKLRAAWLTLQRMTIVAPVSGYVAKREVQVGQHVGANNALMVIVPRGQMWVNANFKESQLDHIRPGQPVSLHSDLYGGSVTFHGTVEGLNAGTGSAFALLPPQNATGNWIKIVQRVPVRVRIAPADLSRHPLRLGLSMTASVDTHATDRNATSDRIDPPAVYTTPVYDQRLQGADDLIARIVHANDAVDKASRLAQADISGGTNHGQ